MYICVCVHTYHEIRGCLTGAWPSLCDSSSVGCTSCVVAEGFLCHEECNSTGVAFSAQPTFRDFFSDRTSCCMQGPWPSRSECVLGLPCSILISTSVDGEEPLALISPDDGFPCGDASRVSGWAGFDFQNPAGEASRSYFTFGTPLSGTPGVFYRLCWGPSPQAFWGSDKLRLLGIVLSMMLVAPAGFCLVFSCQRRKSKNAK